MIKKLLIPLSIILLSSSLAGCEKPTPPNPTDDYYDYSWTPGENAIEGASQVANKNPQGNPTVLNEMRRTQNKAGLPSKGDANILVVPVTFSQDSRFELEFGLDLTFDTDDINNINDAFFNEKASTKFPSVTSFYEESSYNQVHLSGVVSPVVEFDKSFFECLDLVLYNSYMPEDITAMIVEYVYNYLFVETETYYIGDFDSDDDHKIDAIHLIYTFPYGLDVGDSTANSVMYKLLGPDNVYFSDILSKDVPVNSFASISDSFRNILTTRSDEKDAHILISQVGKMMGLYEGADMRGDADGFYRAPLGYVDPLDGFIGDHNPFSKYQLGWTNPKTIKASDIPDEGLVIDLYPSVERDSSLILYTGEHSMFSEYLILDFYTAKGLNLYDSQATYLYGNKNFSESGVRVYHADARLIRGYGTTYVPYDDEIDFEARATLSNGTEMPYVYNYRHTNHAINDYYYYGYTSNNPLVTFLTSDGLNRHMTDYSNTLTDSDLFTRGDWFGHDNQIGGFYKDFAFNDEYGSGEKLNIVFQVTNINVEKATIKLWRAE